MDIPLEKAVPAVLRQGNVFYFVDPSILSTDPHNYVLLSKQPTSERKLVFVLGTSKVEKVRRYRAAQPPATLVVVVPQDYRDFTCETMFDCNSPREIAVADGVRFGNTEGRLKPRDHIGMSILERLVNGILASPVVEERIKKEIA